MSCSSSSSTLSFASQEAIPYFPSTRRQRLALTIRLLLTFLVLACWAYACHFLFGALFVLATSKSAGGGIQKQWLWLLITSIGLLIGGLLATGMLRLIWERHWRIPRFVVTTTGEENGTGYGDGYGYDDDDEECSCQEFCWMTFFGYRRRRNRNSEDIRVETSFLQIFLFVVATILRIFVAILSWLLVTLFIFNIFIMEMKDAEHRMPVFRGPYGLFASLNAILIIVCAALFRYFCLPCPSDTPGSTRGGSFLPLRDDDTEIVQLSIGLITPTINRRSERPNDRDDYDVAVAIGEEEIYYRDIENL